jgi:tight adherence protein B
MAQLKPIHFLMITLFLTFLCLVEGLYWTFLNPERRREARLKKRLEALKGQDFSTQEQSFLKEGVVEKTSLAQMVSKLTGAKTLQGLLQGADVNVRLETFYLIILGCGILGLILGFLKSGPLGALIGAFLGGITPVQLLKMKKKRRLKRFEKMLPDALDLMARGLKAGHAFASGLQLVANEMGDPLGTEFLRTYKEYNYGLELNQALENMCSRVDLRDLRFFTTAVMIQRETGGNLAEVLEKISTLIRERFKLVNQIKALTAEGRLSGIILVGLPPATGLGLYLMNPDYIMLLFNRSLGHIMTIGALFFQTLGMLTIRKIVNIKV